MVILMVKIVVSSKVRCSVDDWQSYFVYMVQWCLLVRLVVENIIFVFLGLDQFFGKWFVDFGVQVVDMGFYYVCGWIEIYVLYLF